MECDLGPLGHIWLSTAPLAARVNVHFVLPCPHSTTKVAHIFIPNAVVYFLHWVFTVQVFDKDIYTMWGDQVI